MKKSELKQLIKEVIREVQQGKAPVYTVIDIASKTPIGHFQYGVGYVANPAGEKMGYKSSKDGIQDGAKILYDKKDDAEDPDDLAAANW